MEDKTVVDTSNLPPGSRILLRDGTLGEEILDASTQDPAKRTRIRLPNGMTAIPILKTRPWEASSMAEDGDESDDDEEGDSSKWDGSYTGSEEDEGETGKNLASKKEIGEETASEKETSEKEAGE